MSWFQRAIKNKEEPTLQPASDNVDKDVLVPVGVTSSPSSRTSSMVVWVLLEVEALLTVIDPIEAMDDS